MLLLNCGGKVSLKDMMIPFENKKIKAVLLDSHRPFHHVNVCSSSKNLILIDDNMIDKDNCP